MEADTKKQDGLTKVAVDAMGGDNAPAAVVKGAVEAVSSRGDIKVFLVGQTDAIQKELDRYQYPGAQIEIVEAPEVIEMAEPPVQAVRKKKAVINCNRHEYGKAEGSRRICFRREFGGGTRRRTDDYRTD